MRIHKEATGTMLVVFIFSLIINALAWYFAPLFLIATAAIALFFIIFFLRFFRYPVRIAPTNIHESDIISPCDGKVVVIEKVFEGEYFKEERMQVSIFMSPNNVHVNWVPTEGEINYVKYHKGLFLVAWDPKSSTQNERTSIVIKNPKGFEVLTRQIAGYVARRIVFYVKEKQIVKRNDEIGFIKLGSRVDLLLPLNADIKVRLNDLVTGNKSLIAKMS